MVSMGDFSVILPVHNEERLLLRTFQTICRLDPQEVLVVLDRPADRSEHIIKKIGARYGSNLTFLKIKAKKPFRNHLNVLYQLGINIAENEICLLTQADVALDPKTKRFIPMARHRILFFRCLPYLGWNTIVTLTLSNLPLLKVSGIITLSRELYERYNLIEEVSIPFEKQIGIKIRKHNIPYSYIKTNSWNLRPYIRRRLYRTGKMRRKLGKGSIQTLLLSVLRAQPEVMVGYIKGEGICGSE